MATKRKRPIEVLTPAEVDRLLKACGKGPSGLRNRALIAALYFGGLRRGETLALEVRDVRERAGEILIRKGKGSRQRTVALPPAGMALVQAWLVKRTAYPGRAVFCKISKGTSGPIAPAYVHQLIRTLARRAGLEKRCHAHGLRHSHSHQLLELGANVLEIQAQLGHSSLAVTEVYLRELNPRARVDRINHLWQ